MRMAVDVHYERNGKVVVAFRGGRPRSYFVNPGEWSLRRLCGLLNDYVYGERRGYYLVQPNGWTWLRKWW